MSRQVIDAYYTIKNQIHHSMTCLIPENACNCGVDAFKDAIAKLQEMQSTMVVPDDIYYSVEHQNFYHKVTKKGQGILFWNAWRQYADKFPRG